MTAATVAPTVPARRAVSVQMAAIDRFGLFGVEQISISRPSAVGIALLDAGAALSLAR
jgi:uncharacterized membrane protein YdcZ (DUF606 family)